jgi:group I intron endonuclease
MYIGSSIDIGIRLVQHLVINNTNEHLQYAINKYGLDNFSFCVVEFYEVDPEVSQETNKANLLAMEQKHLDWLFSLPKELRYNFNPTANSRLGATHSDDTRAKISKAHTGKTHTEKTLA